jgi:serine protease Do
MAYFTRILIIISMVLLAAGAQARTMPDSFADIVERAMPAVVNVSTTQTVEVSSNPFGMFSDQLPNGEMFEGLPDLLEKFYGFRRDGDKDSKQERKATSLGSGFVVSPEGYIVTNNHVIENADEITIIFSDESRADATVVGRDSKTDIALLKVDVDHKLTSVEWGDSDKARVGDWVIAIGNPFGLGGSVSAGIVSARARDINAGPFDDFLQTDAAINRGNSGGPLFNIKGEVIGINTAIFSPSGGNVGIGFAVPSSLSWPVIQQLKEYGKTQRGWLGVKIQTVTDEIAESLGMEKSEGALVVEVTPGSPAGNAGIQAGDVITAFDGKEVATMRKLPRIVAETKIDKKVVVTVWRKGREKTLIVTVAELEEDQAAQGDEEKTEQAPSKEEKGIGLLGMSVTELNDELRKRYRTSDDIKGVLVLDVDHGSQALQKGIRAGDVITSVNQQVVESIKDIKTQIDKAKKSKRQSILLLVNRRGEVQFIALPVEEEKKEEESK